MSAGQGQHTVVGPDGTTEPLGMLIDDAHVPMIMGSAAVARMTPAPGDAQTPGVSCAALVVQVWLVDKVVAFEQVTAEPSQAQGEQVRSSLKDV